MVLPTYAKVLDRAIIVEQDEDERKSYQDHKRRQKDQVRQKQHKVGLSGKSNEGNQQRPEVGHLKKDCPKLRTGANAVSVIGYGGRNAMPGGNENIQAIRGAGVAVGMSRRRGRVFALMPRDPRK
ncbi:hypothetical protein Acr_00g0011560 [Actinidia rufa]|uniref:Uncharacterized protein n=1 Tax=Actinidia rufa TaxID=165716 RepID=A0A7J0D9I3_9ERIC|nr:hypothetical protein Acr_00g0011560 [Actinidia rufa]